MIQDTEPMLTSYPNPFINEFSIRINGADDELADIAVFTSFGKPVETMRELRTNTNYLNVGQLWEKGIYLIRISKNGKTKNYTVVKE